MKAKVAIIGASISGCLAAAELKHLNFEISVFEKTKGIFNDRGAGITLPIELFQHLIDKQILPPDFAATPISERIISFYNQQTKQDSLISQFPSGAVAVKWLNLYQGFVKHLENIDCYYQSEVTAVNNQDEYVELTLNNHEQLQFDYVIFADGYNSIGRKTLYPNLVPHFVNYIAWRGLVRLDSTKLLDILPVFQRESYNVLYQHGHFLLYPIQDIKNGDLLINWIIYETIDNQHKLFGQDQTKATQNIICGKMNNQYREYLYELSRHLPLFVQKIIMATAEPFTQAIYDLFVPSHVVKHSCLMGDAATVVRPHVAAGATKAIFDVINLTKHLKNNVSLTEAFANWNNEQIQSDKMLFDLSSDLGKLLVTEIPDLTTTSKNEIFELWQKIANKHHWYKGFSAYPDKSTE